MWPCFALEKVCNVEYGTRVVRKKDQGTLYPVYGGGGKTFSVDHINRSDRVVIARFAMSAQCTRIVDGEFFLNDSGLTISSLSVELIRQDFLDWYVLGLNETIYALGRGTAQRNLDVDAFRKIAISVPPIPEQQSIVAILDQAFADIEKARANAEQNLKNARELFDSYLQQVFSQRGEGWVEETLGQATGGVYTGPFGSLLHKSDYIENGIPLVNPAHITKTGILADKNKSVSLGVVERLSNYVMREGDIVIGRRGEMGRCALVTKKEDGFLCGTGSFFIKSSSRCYGGYLVRFLRSVSCKAQLEAIAGGAVMPNLSNKDLSSFALYLPSYERQKELATEIALVAKRTRNLVNVYETKISSLDELKKSLLQKAFSGELTKGEGRAA